MMSYIDQLVECRTPVSPGTTCHEVHELFMLDPDALCVAVVEDDYVAGLVNRQDFLLRYTYQLGPDLYGRRSITHLMDAAPMVVDAGIAFEDLSDKIGGSRASGLLRGFVVTVAGRYYGVGTALTLLRLMLDLSENRSAALEVERLRVEEANRSKTEFLASMSHELRTPLNAIIGFTDFIASEPFGPVTPTKYGEYITDVNASAHHLLGLINELLDMAKIEAGKMELAEDEFPAIEPVLQAVNMLRQQVADAGLTLQMDLLDETALIFADKQMTRQVVINLLSNAIKFTPRGGRILIRSERLPDGLRLTVSDTGIGIPADRIERVLEPFEQVENAMSRSRPGTGLGLPLSKAMVEAHGGTLSLSSTFGEGTRVDIMLPVERIVMARLGTINAA
ncbi:sensor histidine kinase [Pyruvatibacter mobilis]|uniref:sensor histidine kinase n=1 Tax=Pyruvatibacter mobilis TaxID=1712261 RepID=UPI003C7B18FC